MTDFNRSEEAQNIFKEKRKPKNPITFKITLNEEQKEAKQIILDHPVTLLKGMAGSGKTLVACQVALDLMFRKDIERIIITRPTVAKEEIGFLPGDLKEKMDPWLAPIYANLHMLYDKTKIEKMVADGQIEIVPFAFMRGRTFPDAVVIVDECQNITHGQTEMILGRLGKGGKMIFCGDITQTDLKQKKDSGIGFFTRLEAEIKGVKVITLKTNHRHEIVEPILKLYSDYRDWYLWVKHTMADLTVLINEKITLDGNDRGVLTTQTITGISNIDNRILTIPTSSNTSLFYFAPGENSGAAFFSTGSFKYGRITNKSTVPIIVTINSRDVVNDTNYYSLNNVVEPGSSFCLSSTQVTSSIISSNFNFIRDYIYEVLALPSGSSATIEYFIATT